MLFTLGHGQKNVLSTDTAPGALSGLAPSARTDAINYGQATAKATSTVPAGAVGMFQRGATLGGSFESLFPNAPISTTDGITLTKLDALDDAMREAANDPPQAVNANPPVHSGFDQDIDHDIKAGTSRKGTQLIIEPPAGQTLDPLPKSDVTAPLLNLRKGLLGLDGLFSDGPSDEQAATKLKEALRLPSSAGMMRLSVPTDLSGRPSRPAGDAERLTRWHYQWLVMDIYLNKVCGSAIVADVVANGAVSYASFLDRVKVGNGRSLPDEDLLMSLEFLVAAIRFGHSPLRGTYEHNRAFNRVSAPIMPRAGFDFLFGFTGGGRPGNHPALPTNRVIEWDRFTFDTPTESNHVARYIDTQLAPPLSNMAKEAAGVFNQLPPHNMRRGHRLNIPSAQACIDGFNTESYGGIAPLTAAELTSGETGQAVADGGLAQETPLWFYILREAEVQAQGAHLGQLGNQIIDGTLLRLTNCDQTSYWHQSGSDNGRWHPQDGMQPDGIVVDDIPAMIRATLWM